MAPRHVALVAAPGLGHVLPLLRLAHVLQRRGLLVSFIVSDLPLQELQRRKLPEALHTPRTLRLLPIASRGIATGPDALASPLALMSLYMAMIQPASALLDALSRAQAPPSTDGNDQHKQPAWPALTAVVASPFIFFGPAALRDHPHVRWTTLIDMSVPGCIATNRLAEAALDALPPSHVDAPTTPILLPDGFDIAPAALHIPADDLINVFGETQLSVKSPTVGLATGFRKLFIDSHDILLNTTASLDNDLLPLLQTRLAPNECTAKKLYPIGPIDLAWDGGGRDAPLRSTSVDHFLNAHPARSVLYVAFGTLSTLPAAELADLVQALHDHPSVPFVLVSAPLHRELGQPQPRGGTTEHLRAMLQTPPTRGLLLPWAPQQLILRHTSTGLFFSHGGWNSALEALSHGVPMLLRPFLAEQSINARALSAHHNVARRLVPANTAQQHTWSIADAVAALAALHAAPSTAPPAADQLRSMHVRAAALAEAIRRDAVGLLRPALAGEEAPEQRGRSAVALEAWLSDAGLV